MAAWAPPIALYARADGNEVRDFGHRPGQGHPRQDLDGIFEKFYRRGKVDGRLPERVLAFLSPGFVEAMGGTINAESPGGPQARHPYRRAPSGPASDARSPGEHMSRIASSSSTTNRRSSAFCSRRSPRPATTSSRPAPVPTRRSLRRRRRRRRHPRPRPARHGRQGGDRQAARLVEGADHRPLRPRPGDREDRRARPRRRRLCRKALRHRRTDRAHPHRPAPPRRRRGRARPNSVDGLAIEGAPVVPRDGKR